MMGMLCVKIWEKLIMEPWQMFTIVGANLTVFLGFMGTVIALHLQNSKKIDANQNAIQSEMKDFHGRLCAIEERRNKILER